MIRRNYSDREHPDRNLFLDANDPYLHGPELHTFDSQSGSSLDFDIHTMQPSLDPLPEMNDVLDIYERQFDTGLLHEPQELHDNLTIEPLLSLLQPIDPLEPSPEEMEWIRSDQLGHSLNDLPANDDFEHVDPYVPRPVDTVRTVSFGRVRSKLSGSGRTNDSEEDLVQFASDKVNDDELVEWYVIDDDDFEEDDDSIEDEEDDEEDDYYNEELEKN